MYCLSDICSLCLIPNRPNQNLTSISSQDIDGTLIEEKLGCFLLELINFKPNISKYICNNCLENLNFIYKFRQSCLQNIITLKKYAEKLQDNELQKKLSIPVITIKCEKDSIEFDNEENTCVKENESDKNLLNEKQINETNYLFHQNTIFLPENNETDSSKVVVKTEIIEQEYENNSNNCQVSYEDFQKFNEEKHIIGENESINSNSSYTQENCLEDIIVNNEYDDNQMSFEESKGIDADTSDNSTGFQELSEEVEMRLIPQKSKDAYYKEYEKLNMWMQSKNSGKVNETIMLAYMVEMSGVYKSSTLWCMYSKLQAMLRIKNGVDLASFKKLQTFMKGINKSYESNKSYVFSEGELAKFFVQAPDMAFLFLKIVAICGIFGSCRRHEMCDLRLSDITHEESALIINIRPSKTEKGRKFAVVDSGIPYMQLFKKYLSLRPQKVSTDRVFLKYTNGTCTTQVVGINTFGKCPALVARFLNLENFDKYTGHAFRRTSATIMANSGLSTEELKHQTGWKSSIEESTVNKLEISELIAGVVNRATVSPVDDLLQDSESIENEAIVASTSTVNDAKPIANENSNKNQNSSKEIILHKCPVCQNVFISLSLLEKHSLVHTGDRPYECQTCNKTFKRPEHLKTHSRIHSGEKPYECEVCLKTFTQQGHLSEHKRIHTNDRPFKCTVCDMTFNVNSTLTRHLRRHTFDKPFHCHLCQHKFLTKSGLKLHIRSHTGEKPYKCSLCHLKFTTSGRLTVHLRTHTGDRPYQCYLCQYKAATSTHLKTHMRKHRNILSDTTSE